MLKCASAMPPVSWMSNAANTMKALAQASLDTSDPGSIRYSANGTRLAGTPTRRAVRSPPVVAPIAMHTRAPSAPVASITLSARTLEEWRT
jgi:hypothetical protein